MPETAIHQGEEKKGDSNGMMKEITPNGTYNMFQLKAQVTNPRTHTPSTPYP